MFPRTTFIVVCLLLSCGLLAQEPGISVSADKKKILLGEPFHLQLKAVYPIGKGTNGFDSIPHFEMTEKPVADSSSNGGLVILNIKYTLTSFDSGHWVIPSLALNKKQRSDTIPIDVLFSDFDTSQPYHSIKDILAAAPEKKNYWYWYMAAGIVLLVFLLYYFLKNRKKPVMQAAREGRDPYQEAMAELNRIRNDRSDPRQYYSRLVWLFRVYLKRKKNMQSLQKTSADLIIKIKELPLGKEEMEDIAKTLRLSDMVKFAKYLPEPAEMENSWELIRSAIDHIESLDKSVNPA